MIHWAPFTVVECCASSVTLHLQEVEGADALISNTPWQHAGRQYGTSPHRNFRTLEELQLRILFEVTGVGTTTSVAMLPSTRGHEQSHVDVDRQITRRGYAYSTMLHNTALTPSIWLTFLKKSKESNGDVNHCNCKLQIDIVNA